MLSTEAALRKDTTTRATLEHRHFATIAAILRDAPGNEDQRTNLCHHFAYCLADTNPRFDRKRFLKACGVEA